MRPMTLSQAAKHYEGTGLTRTAIMEYYTSVLYTRLEKNGSILLTLTRWHEDDLAGRLLSLAAADPVADQWIVINFPAVAESVLHPDDPRMEGEALWPERFPIETLAATKASIGSYDWNALYQQHPASAEGGLFKREWWKFWTEIPQNAEYIQSWDCTFKSADTSDFVVGQVWACDGANRYLIDQVRKRMSFSETLQSIREMSRY